MTNPHYAWLPPEVNSALMFTGPGSGPLLAAAAAWNDLAEELAQSAASFWAVTSELVSRSWLGASSAVMMAVASQYSEWLRTAAAQAEGAAGQATAVADVFDAALTAAVQPPVVAANRGLVQVLAGTNWLGQNAPAIADVDAAYEQMWAMDVAAMSGYHVNASALVAELPSWDQVLEGLDIADLGFGNPGKSHIGIAKAGTENIGFGLTGGHPISIGLLDSASAKIGFGNPGTGDTSILNSGALNTGVGNTGANNLGFWNAGFGQTGWPNKSAQQTSSLLGFDNITGAVGSAGLDPTSTVASGSSAEVASSALLSPRLISALIPSPAVAPIGSPV